ncbi:MAG: hypothetical protein SFY92_03985 [Verrucomicrobiae bacterium]|nr:hypothetical protein [Verrucomicrobiae bacterium]
MENKPAPAPAAPAAPCSKGTCPPCQDSKKSTASAAGKGHAPRNLSAKFRSNYDQINWSAKPKSKTGKKRVFKY